MSKGTNEVTACVVCHPNELEISISVFLSGWAQGSCAGNQNPMTLCLHEVAFLLLEGCPIPQANLVLDSPS